MAYITSADLVRVLPAHLQKQLLDDNHDGIEDDGLAAKIILSAEGLVNGFIGSRYVVPIAGTVPETVKQLALEAARYYAHHRIGRLDDKIVRAYELLLDQLRMIQDGSFSLGIDPVPTERSDMRSTMSSATRVFSRSSMSELP